jgi:putative phosphoribosyl transferase
MAFSDRAHAGRLLAARLKELPLGPNPLVIALPRGGVPVAYEIAYSLELPLDVLVVRKIGAPDNPEYGLGAITEGGMSWIDWDRATREGFSSSELARVQAHEQVELGRRVRKYRRGRPRLPVIGRAVILVDDGLATGGSARAACRLLRAQGAERIILAVPVCPANTRARFRGEADELVCLAELDRMIAVGQHYENFEEISDEEVSERLENAHAILELAERLPREHELVIDSPEAQLPGILTVPKDALGLVLFAHGSGSNRLSPRNQSVATLFQQAGLATLLFDLLTHEESELREHVFDIPLLARRLMLATAWVDRQPRLRALTLGYFGASTGAAAALWAASELGTRVSAIVSRGGRPDLALPLLHAVNAPTLLIVGALDTEVLALNRKAQARLPHGRIAVVGGATHLFEEPGALEEAARLALEWFERHLARARFAA